MRKFMMIRLFFPIQLILIILIYSSKVGAQEKVMLSTDRDIYIVGEDLWFNVGAYQLDTNLTSRLSKIIHIELINKMNIPVLQAKCMVDKTSVQSRILLPDTLSTGNYSLRAYTRWMQNKDQTLFAKKNISIINPFANNNFPESDKCFEQDTILTFPEGGILSPGIENKIMIRSLDSTGERKSIEGQIVDGNNKLISSFKTDDNGCFFFTFVPEVGGVYSYCFNAMKIQMPPVSNNQIYLQLREQNLDSYTFKTIGQSGHVLCLDIVSQDGKFVKRYNIPADGKIKVAVKELKEGQFYALLLDDKNQVLAYRAFAVNINQKANINIRTDEKYYGRRDKVNLTIDRLNNLNDISVSVVKSCLLNKRKSLPESSLNNDFLISLQPPLFLSKKPNHIFLPEKEGEFLTGKITNNGEAIADEKLMLSFVSHSPILKFSTTDSLGRFKFVVNRYGEEEMVIQPFSNDTSLYNYKVTLDDVFSSDYSQKKSQAFVMDSITAKEINQAIVNMQINTIYSSYKKDQAVEDSIQKTDAFYGKPDVSVAVNKYIALPTVEEVVREIIPFVRLRRNNGSYVFKVYEDISMYPRKCQTLTLMDGVPIKNIKSIFEISPNELQKIEVVNLSFYLKDEELGYLLCFYTRDGNMADMDFDQRLFRQVHNGCISSYRFKNPNYSDYEIKTSRLADFRNVLYYNVFCQNRSEELLKVSFYTSDEETEYTIVVKGVNEQGQFIEKRKEIIVSEDLKHL